MVSVVNRGVCGEGVWGSEGAERYKEPRKGVWRTEEEEERKKSPCHTRENKVLIQAQTTAVDVKVG